MTKQTGILRHDTRDDNQPGNGGHPFSIYLALPLPMTKLALSTSNCSTHVEKLFAHCFLRKAYICEKMMDSAFDFGVSFHLKLSSLTAFSENKISLVLMCKALGMYI
jgi:hypothetical protein